MEEITEKDLLELGGYKDSDDGFNIVIEEEEVLLLCYPKRKSWDLLVQHAEIKLTPFADKAALLNFLKTFKEYKQPAELNCDRFCGIPLGAFAVPLILNIRSSEFPKKKWVDNPKEGE